MSRASHFDTMTRCATRRLCSAHVDDGDDDNNDHGHGGDDCDDDGDDDDGDDDVDDDDDDDDDDSTESANQNQTCKPEHNVHSDRQREVRAQKPRRNSFEKLTQTHTWKIKSKTSVLPRRNAHFNKKQSTET